MCKSNSVYSNQCIIDTQGHSATGALPKKKKLKISTEPIELGEVSSQELMDLLGRFDYTMQSQKR